MVIAVDERTSQTRFVTASHGEVKAALWLWSALALAIGLSGFVVGGEGADRAVASGALAFGPAAISLVALPFTDRPLSRVGVPAAWIAAATLATGLTGGFGSPISAVFAIAPALGYRLHGAASALETTLFALFGFLLAGVAAQDLTAFQPPAPGMFVFAAIALSGALVAWPRSDRQSPDALPVRRIAEVSHELKTPLNHIIGFAEMMAHGVLGPAPEKYAEYSGLIVASGRRMLGLVNDWLDLGRLAEGRFDIARENCDLAAIAADAVRDASLALADRPGALRLMTEGKRPAHVDPRAARQILDNLIANALKFSPPDAGVRVWVRRVRDVAVIEVSDEGPGLTDSEKARLGAAFVRGANVQGAEGTGLGLALVRALSEAHGGKLFLLDSPGGGALVRVALPDGQTGVSAA